MTLKQIVEELLRCDFHCEAGPLKNFTVFQELQKIANQENDAK